MSVLKMIREIKSEAVRAFNDTLKASPRASVREAVVNAVAAGMSVVTRYEFPAECFKEVMDLAICASVLAVGAHVIESNGGDPSNVDAHSVVYLVLLAAAVRREDGSVRVNREFAERVLEACGVPVESMLRGDRLISPEEVARAGGV